MEGGGEGGGSYSQVRSISLEYFYRPISAQQGEPPTQEPGNKGVNEFIEPTGRPAIGVPTGKDEL